MQNEGGTQRLLGQLEITRKSAEQKNKIVGALGLHIPG